MNYLIDTNIISEVRKGAKCDRRVAAWYESIADTDIYLSVLVVGEIRKGIERAKPNDPLRARVLEKWLADVVGSFAERILPVDRTVADEWGRMSAARSLSIIDALLAATAKVNGITLATRNVTDVADLGVNVLNPFEW
ncbi:MAG: type II toxin-antitoxin system VapC family toxin [Xanthobacteraceae bacterium]